MMAPGAATQGIARSQRRVVAPGRASIERGLLGVHVPAERSRAGFQPRLLGGIEHPTAGQEPHPFRCFHAEARAAAGNDVDQKLRVLSEGDL